MLAQVGLSPSIPQQLAIGVLVLVGFACVAFAKLFGPFLQLYIQARLSKARVGVWEIIGMRLRHADVPAIVFSRIRSEKAGIPVRASDLELHDLAGGDIAGVIGALIEAKRAGVPLDFETACAADLQGFDPLAGVHAIVHAGGPGVEGDDPYSAHALVLLMRERGRSTAGLRLPPLPDARPG